MIRLDNAVAIAKRFQIPEPIEVQDFAGKGNINLDTVLVLAGPNRVPFLMQRINDAVFSMPTRVMQGMIASLDAQKTALIVGHSEATDWRVPSLVKTDTDEFFLERNGIWRMFTFLEGTTTYKSLSQVPDERRLFTASEVGRGLAIYSDLTHAIDSSTVSTSLPGYRNTRLYFHQLHASLEGARNRAHAYHRLPEDEETRLSTEQHFYCVLEEEERLARRNDPELMPYIQLALRYESLAIRMQELRETGVIRQTAIHGDTKLENFLFDAVSGRVVSLVDLDTVMPHSWLADWGDMVRSLANVAGETERDISKVVVDQEVYAAVMEGFLSAATTPTDDEIALMPQAVQTIALELGIRFLADYLRGDTYFLVPEGADRDLNKVRAMVQLRLFEKLLKHESQANDLIKKVRGLAVR